MKRRKIEILFMAILLAITLILFKTIIIYKNNLIEHPLTYPLFGIVSISFILFNYWILNFKWVQNIAYSIPIILASLILAFVINGLIISLMLKLDEGRTPLGWTFNYTWFTLLIFGLLLVFSTEVIGMRMNKNICLTRYKRH